MQLNIPDTELPRIVIVGAGFAGLQLAKKLARKSFQVVLLDKNNYHQFQPLFYQVAMAGLEPSSISFPIRKLFQKKENVHIRVCELTSIDHEAQSVSTSIGSLRYDELVIAIGAKTNFFGNKEFEERAFSIKSVNEALAMRNAIFLDYERALIEEDYDKRQELIDIVIVGGGATGVELAGALAEMKNYILPKDYPELDYKEMDVYLIQSGDRLLNGMSVKSSVKAEEFLKKIGVNVIKNTRVTEIEDGYVVTENGDQIPASKVIWAAGVNCPLIEGIPTESLDHFNRLKVNSIHEVEGMDHVYAIGDIALMRSDEYPEGHPQVAQVAIQQADNLYNNLHRSPTREFLYKDKGTMATIGRNKAVVDLPKTQFSGFFAWVLWLFVHLFAIIGVKNKVFVFLNWVWNYFTYDQSLRLIIRPAKEKKKYQER